MERGGSFNRVPRHANSVPAEDIPTESHGGPDINIARTGGAPTRTRTGGGTVREQDQFMPIANVIRIMRRILPPHAKISDDAKETVQDCVSEYISFVTGEANDRCQREQRKTITAEDVIWAMGKLGFDDYVEPLTVFLNRFREIESDRTSLRGEPLVKRTVEYAAVPPASPVPPLPQARVPPYAAPFYHSQVAHQPPPGFFSGNYFPGSGSSSGRGPGGGAATSASSSGSQAALFNINDPYAQFK